MGQIEVKRRRLFISEEHEKKLRHELEHNVQLEHDLADCWKLMHESGFRPGKAVSFHTTYRLLHNSSERLKGHIEALLNSGAV